jgi:hypothetical protein
VGNILEYLKSLQQLLRNAVCRQHVGGFFLCIAKCGDSVNGENGVSPRPREPATIPRPLCGPRERLNAKEFRGLS